MTILLISPPVTDAAQPYLALPALAGALRAAGHATDLRDMGLEAFDYFTDPAFLRSAVERIRQHRRDAARDWTNDDRDLASALFGADPTIREIGFAHQVFRDPRLFYDYAAYRRAYHIFYNAFRLISQAYAPLKISFHECEIAERHTASALRSFIGNETDNPFRRFFRERLLERVGDNPPTLIGISVTFRAQLIAGLTLAEMVKKLGLDIPVIFGGAFLTASWEHVWHSDLVWDVCDAIVLHEGESAIVAIADRLADGRDFTGIPNVFPSRQVLPTASSVFVEDLRHLPAPDFSGMPIHRYASPELVLPVQTCRGCYWSRCAFCSVSRATRSAYRQVGHETLMQRLDDLHERFGAKVFFLADDATGVGTMRALACDIKESGRPYHWGTEARFEKRLGPEVCEDLFQGGCLSLIFGFESAVQRVRGLMRKGTDVKVSMDVLEACRHAGIAVNLQAFIGFPGESIEEAIETERFFRDNKGLYTALGLGQFMAVEGSSVALEPGQFGIRFTGQEPETIEAWRPVERVGDLPTSDAVTQRFRAMYRALRNEDILGPGLLCGTSGAHGILYLRERGRAFVDALGGEVHTCWGLDAEASVRLAPWVSVLNWAPQESLLVDTRGGVAMAVSGAVSSVVNMFKDKPRPVVGAVTAAVLGSEGNVTAVTLEEIGDAMCAVTQMVRAGLIEEQLAEY